MKKNYQIKILTLCVSVLLASCASKRVAQKETLPEQKVQQSVTPSGEEQNEATQQLSFVQKVFDNQVYTKNIIGSMSFSLQAGSKDISVPGTLRMRKDEVIRIQLMIPILGTEVGRLEFTPDYVLIVDRIHKEYIKADYNQVDFLKKQGVSFYSLQALFWNQLVLPDTNGVSESDLKKFDADLSVLSDDVPVTYQHGTMTYRWTTDRSTGRISQANVQYKSAKGETSSLNFKYDNFKSVGVKYFPAHQYLTLRTDATKNVKEVKINMDLSDVKTNANWDAHTEVSAKYKKVAPEDVLGKIMNM